MAASAPSPRTRLSRYPKRAAYERAAIEAILDDAIVCHLGFAVDGQPYVIPTLHARVGDVVYVHGSSASRMLRTLAEGVPACLTVTHVDGVVLARSAMNHSMNYRSAVVLGTLRLVEDPTEKERALAAFTDQLIPGRWEEIRWPTAQELKATKVLAMSLDEASAKVRSGPPGDDEEDYALPVWAGVLPLSTAVGSPIPDERMAPGTPVPDYVSQWPSNRGSSSSETARSTDSGANGASSSDARSA